MAKDQEVWVIATTSHRDVWYGRLEADEGKRVILADARHCFQWGQTFGLSSLAVTGPGDGHKIGQPAPRVRLNDIVAVIECEPAAVAGFAAAGWSA